MSEKFLGFNPVIFSVVSAVTKGVPQTKHSVRDYSHSSVHVKMCIRQFGASHPVVYDVCAARSSFIGTEVCTYNL
jgi:hypothetical protein